METLKLPLSLVLFWITAGTLYWTIHAVLNYLTWAGRCS